jgi:hypothetical protein
MSSSMQCIVIVMQKQHLHWGPIDLDTVLERGIAFALVP